MTKPELTKLVPRNAPALRKMKEPNPQPRLVAGNPVSTRLESGIGNCFPGLECDLRNLERRFFPFLEMDILEMDTGTVVNLVSVDIERAVAAMKSGEIDQSTLNAYLALDLKESWTVETLGGTFGPLGKLTLNIDDIQNIPAAGTWSRPADPWTAIRLLTEGTEVRLVLKQTGRGKKNLRVKISGKRARYLGDDGALAEMFVPGELTQSLCSPWTHDFRDCGCFYWASNHPDIVMPPLPSEATSDPKWDIPVPWERRDRGVDKLPTPATFEDPTNIEFDHYEINLRWQALNFVVERREQNSPYAQREFDGKPLSGKVELERHLRYAAGVELAVIHEYLAAIYSLKPDAALRGRIRDDVRAVRAEIFRIALGEMRHLRAVNDVLARLTRPAYKPALGIATRVPGAKPGQKDIVKPTPLTREAVKRFIAIEAPSQSVDGVYARILATLEESGSDEDRQAVRTVMAEGEDHYRTFLAIREWLKSYSEPEYLRAVDLKPPPALNQEHKDLQKQYRLVLDLLYKGYVTGLPDGGTELNQARMAMLEPNGLDAFADRVADRGFLVVFDTPPDDRFQPVDPP
jgi:hypothetical protein